MRAQLKCRPLFRVKLNNNLILHEWMWMWHYIGAFMWKTDVSLFLSRLAGTVVWRESQLFPLLPETCRFLLQTLLQIFFPLPYTFILRLSVLHLSISPSHLHPLSLPLLLKLSPSPSLFNPLSRCLNPASPPTSLSSSGGHALECSFLHKTTSSHYLLTTPQEVMWADFPTLVTDGGQGQ